jgi:oligopeptidase B
MITTRILFATVLSIAITGCSESKQTPTIEAVSAPVAPVASKRPHKLTAHGQTRVDNYYWMRDDTRSDRKMLDHLAAEDAYSDEMLAPILPLKNQIYNEMVGRIEKDNSTVPALDNDYWYYRRFSGDMEYPIYARKSGPDAAEEILLDGNDMAVGHDYFQIGDYSVSSNNEILAYSTDTVSRRLYNIEFKNLKTHEAHPDLLINTTGRVVWANDNRSVYYIKKDLQTLLGYQVYRHTLGTWQEEDVLMYQEDDSSFYTGLGKSKDNSVIYIHHDSTTKTGTSLIDANAAAPTVTPFLPLEDDLEYSVAKLGEEYYILTNWNAVNFRLMKVAADKTADKSAWQEVLAHRPEVLLEDIELFDAYLVVKEKQRGQSSVYITALATGERQKLDFDEAVYVVNFSNNYQLDSDSLRIYYSSPISPASVYDVSLESLAKTLKKQDKVLGGFTAADYAVERVFIPARDGAQVPVTLMYRKDKFTRDGSNPLYQYGYGSYGSTIEPYFNANYLSLTDRGFVVAVAHIRGSQMLGRPWYEAGKMQNKINTFTDFIDVTEGLIAEKYANPEKAYAEGGSAGGLLIGAVMNMAPQLYDGVAAHVPFVDVVTTMGDASIPLTSNEYDEWGNPANKADYDYMLSYSPYDQVAAIEYPHTLVTTGLHDSQVQYFEPMKWVAKLREMKTDDNMLVFDVDMEAGHGGASGRFRRLQKKALSYAFFIELASR